MSKTTKAIKLTDEEHELVMKAVKKVAVETGGEVVSIRGALMYMVNQKLKKKKG